MGTIQLPPDFKEFLKLLDDKKVRYLIVGGYAVSFHGYPRTTGDIDIWIAVDPANARKVTKVLIEFGFNDSELKEDLFLNANNIIRMGIPPYRIEIINSVTGIEFDTSYAERVVEIIDGITVNIISKKDLIKNKKAAGRNKDLDDVENLS